MKSRYDFQTEQIKRQCDRVMAASAARTTRDQTIKVSYEARHINYDTFRTKMAESRREMFRQEKIACLDYKIAMMQFDRQMFTDHPETFVAPKE